MLWTELQQKKRVNVRVAPEKLAAGQMLSKPILHIMMFDYKDEQLF